MTRQERALEAVRVLKERYPDAACSLQYEKPYELMIATRLSAQCTDARVNLVTPELFERFPSLEAFAEADLAELEAIVRPCGFYKTKAQSIKAAAQRLLEVYGGVLPDTMEELLTLPGVGRKTSNLLLGDIYGKPAIVTDTHCIRLVNRIGLVNGIKEPAKVEEKLWKIIPHEEGNAFCHRLVDHGRAVCTARTKPFCDKCCLKDVCKKAGL